LKNSLIASCALLLGALITCCALAQAPSVTVTDAWVRATPGSDVAAVYLTVRNATGSPVTVTGVESPVADAMIHESTVEGGVSRMRPQGAIIIAPGQILQFAPGGLHVMLHGLKHPLSPGDSVPVVLRLKSGGSLSFQARVRPLNAP
jgi:periplasmic copper chaperone A